ncbi:MAG: flagellar biosynthesis protein FliQ [Thermodesulfobacteriota bacterium]|nr:flagellar biosynthesis protein FliQ [Thermodesulfobacteriota bacterium]
MSPEFVISMGKEAIWITILCAMPMLGLGLVVGLAVAIFQAVTSIQEMTLTFIPKILVVLFSMLFFAPWILEKMMSFTQKLIENIPMYIR